jgi:DivIVA domain-containing protein
MSDYGVSQIRDERGVMTENMDPELVPGMATVVEDLPVGTFANQQFAHFDVVMRGYDRRQVDDYLARAAAVDAQMRSELERGRPSFDALGKRVTQMLELAEAEAEQMRMQAREEAARVRQQAAREAEELGAAARRELNALHERRAALLADLAMVRATVEQTLAQAASVWPSDAPLPPAGSSELRSSDALDHGFDPGSHVATDEMLTNIDLTATDPVIAAPPRSPDSAATD